MVFSRSLYFPLFIKCRGQNAYTINVSNIQVTTEIGEILGMDRPERMNTACMATIYVNVIYGSVNTYFPHSVTHYIT